MATAEAHGSPPFFLVSCPRMLRAFVFLCLLAPLTAQRVDQNLHSTLWMQRSAEYAALTTQTYRAAGLALAAGLADPHWTAAYEQTNDFRTLPPAVILDLDETVLDNSAAQVKLIKEGKSFTEEHFAAWVKEARAAAIPGAVEFLHAAVLKGVAPHYVTNRFCNPSDPDDPTMAVLRKLRVPVAAERLHCRTSTSNKTDRRRAVADKFRIVLLIGDDFNDFTAVPDDTDQRAELQKFYEPMWGTKWFVLPNPVYGSWERAIGFDLDRKWKALKD